ncbi:hypothetical protein [Robertmurraya andreesenii]|uniref:Uncharacterized protein n=1 Tax=Anoxybacillus andreesenii TaxID=1325932 RepID=A0ABT9V6C7_9BACL|nr:hypothetical protein [Robertmurraya andreesenii]MDQ0156506.1 hypothetical protein [Robertmurraya andreesenii]
MKALFQKNLKITILMLTFALVFTLIPMNTTFANSLENTENLIISDKVITLSNEEYQELVDSLENESNISANVDNNFSTFATDKHNMLNDWTTFLGRSTYTHTSSGGIRQFTNKGNRTAAQAEFGKLGGGGEVTSYVSGNNITHVKKTPAGNVTLYTSSSTTAGAQRPTISFLKDKVRFLGD